MRSMHDVLRAASDHEVEALPSLTDYPGELNLLAAIIRDGPGAWRHEAACVGLPVETFFATPNSARGRFARSVCLGCPVMAQCAEYARSDPYTHGMWGATSTQDRTRTRRAT